ncbi:cytochrome P450 [Pseudovirgaria hyperparasitica]|uniref:Cytochrome P450 n=1 Tax=Pseudovirgaria hyperparasitica TaxID=470096 RepID=A0A6A6WKY1_9PEZI|nr:cytochrome P450 [Pseudovirgaria hyperparasitica]KAF2762831.1 cytochrome P450 [Pseudovirgaria hyperparasitica]
MEIFWALVRFWTNVVILAIFLGMLLRNAPNHIIPFTSRRDTAIISAISAFIYMTLYNVYIYPRYLSPLRKLPQSDLIVDSSEFVPITIAPRGKKTLELVKRYPGADLINLRMVTGSQIALPVSPAAHRAILSEHAADYEKPSSGRYALSRSLGYGLILSEGETHRVHRKAITPSFRIQNIRSLQPLIAKKTSLMLEGIAAEMHEKGQIEISSWGSRLTMDIIGPALMSRDFGSLHSHNSDLEAAYAELVAPSWGAGFLFEMSMMLPPFIVRRLPVKENAMVDRTTTLIRHTCETILRDKMRDLKTAKFGEETGTSDILGSVMANGNLSQNELVDQMMTFLGAGHETTASSIAWVTHLLTLPQYAHYQELLRKEIRDAVSARRADADPDEGILSYSTLEALPLLNGICEETLRLFPPVTNTGRVAIRDTIICDTHIKKNTILVLFPWAINRNPAFWGVNADDMVPERWIDEMPDGTRKANRHGGAPSNMCELTFLHGNRSCIGKDFAKAELRYVIAALFKDHQLKRLPGDDGTVIPAGSLTIKPQGGLYVAVTPVA